MKIHRFIGQFNLNDAEVVISDKKLVHQMVKVLRFKSGQRLILGDGKGGENEGSIKKIDNDNIIISLQKKLAKNKTKGSIITLYLALLKKENFEWVAQKATELGVSEIIPIQTSRVVKQNINRDRLLKIIREATEQSGQKKVPELLPALSFPSALERSRVSEGRWFLDQGSKILLSNKKAKNISLFVGPEGGWTSEEKELAHKAGLQSISISLSTLRAETAAIAGVFLASLHK